MRYYQMMCKLMPVGQEHWTMLQASIISVVIITAFGWLTTSLGLFLTPAAPLLIEMFLSGALTITTTLLGLGIIAIMYLIIIAAIDSTFTCK